MLNNGVVAGCGEPLEDEEMTTIDRLMEESVIVEGLIGPMEDAAPGPDEQHEVFSTGDGESGIVEGCVFVRLIVNLFAF